MSQNIGHYVESVTTDDEISWHVERFMPVSGLGTVVLIPSGEGDCHNLVNLARILCEKYEYHVITFDNPGFSRTSAPPAAYDCVTPQLMATQIANFFIDYTLTR